MARYTGPVCRLCRRESIKLFLKGERCNTFRCSIEKKRGIPGQNAKARHGKVSEFGIQLREKQKTKRIYGLLEKQFRNYFEKADRIIGVTGENLLIYLERRFDNVIYRLGFAPSRKLAKQLVIHKHFLINGKRVDRPSYMLKEGDVISIKQTSKDSLIFKQLIEKKEEAFTKVPDWLEIKEDVLEGKVVRAPMRKDIDISVNEQLIVELYSK
ncbi:30S ribosomal protein S4 [bacterium]